MRRYPDEQAVYEQNLTEIRERGFGVLFVRRRQREQDENDPTWTTVHLVGEEYSNVLIAITSKRILPLTEDEHRQEIAREIREEDERAFASGRFLQIKTDSIGEEEIALSLRLYLPRLFPELIGIPLYRVDQQEFYLPVKYLNEIEEAAQIQHGKNLQQFLSERTPIILTAHEESNEHL